MPSAKAQAYQQRRLQIERALGHTERAIGALASFMDDHRPPAQGRDRRVVVLEKATALQTELEALLVDLYDYRPWSQRD